jgi:membrane protein DedA with SNARE-associated domain
LLFITFADLEALIGTHGYWAVALIVGLESMGLPLPGETVLVLAAIYAGASGDLNIWGIVAAATTGAILGDNAGYWLGRKFGYPLLLKYRRYVRLSERKIKLAQYLFQRHGAKVVFFGRFVALLRILAAFLAGLNHMPWKRFLAANAGGGIVWASFFGFGGYIFGESIRGLGGYLSMAALVGAGIAFFGFGYLVRRRQLALEEEAERAIPGPLEIKRPSK